MSSHQKIKLKKKFFKSYCPGVKHWKKDILLAAAMCQKQNYKQAIHFKISETTHWIIISLRKSNLCTVIQDSAVCLLVLSYCLFWFAAMARKYRFLIYFYCLLDSWLTDSVFGAFSSWIFMTVFLMTMLFKFLLGNNGWISIGIDDKFC